MDSISTLWIKKLFFSILNLSGTQMGNNLVFDFEVLSLLNVDRENNIELKL